MIKYSLIFLVFSLAVWTKLFGQDQAYDTISYAKGKNVIYASLNGYMMAGSALSINYDRRIIKSLYATTGIGKYPLLGDAFKVDLKVTTLIGKRNSHLELAIGVLYGRNKPIEARYIPSYKTTIPYKPASSYFYPAFTVGYRYQNPEGGIVFRAGIGYYEANIGLGYSF